MSDTKTVLVTGGAGFIGSNFIHYLQRSEPEIFIVDLDSLTYAANPDNLRDLPNPSRHHFIEGDIRDRELLDRIMSEYAVRVIVHFAAESHVDRSIQEPGMFVQTNIVGTFNLLEAARKAWQGNQASDPDRPRFHHVSTDEVFGSLHPGGAAFRETDPFAPNSPYAASKAASDHLVRSYFHTYGLPITITNSSNNYGPFQFPEKLVPLMITNALNGRLMPIYGDGRQVRDWIYVEDHCDAIWAVVTRGNAGKTYNVGGENQPTNIEVVDEICGILDDIVPDSPYVPHGNLRRFVSDRPGHDRRYAMDISKIRNELGWKPKEGLSSGLIKTVRWYLDNPEWAEKIASRPAYRTWIDKNYSNRGDKK